MKERIRIGFPVPLSGIYGTEAHEQLMGAQVAIDDFNSEGGLEGRRAELLVRDTELLVEKARLATEELIQKDKVHFIVGALSAADMLAISQVCHKHKVLYNAISQSDSILYKENRSPYLFHEGQNPHMTMGTAARYVFSHLGQRVAFLNADSEFGQHSLRAMLHVGNQIGIEIAANLNYPVGLKNYKEYLLKIQETNPQVLIFNNFGEDQRLSVMQAEELGLKDKMRIVCPVFSVTQRMLGGADIFEGVIGSVAYDWNLQDHYSTASIFNQKYQEKSKGPPPTSYSAYGYNGVRAVLEACRQAGTISTEEVIKKMLSMRFDFCKGPQFYRRLDHQSVQVILMVESKSASETKSKYDLFEILEIIDFLGPRTFLISRETI